MVIVYLALGAAGAVVGAAVSAMIGFALWPTLAIGWLSGVAAVGVAAYARARSLEPTASSARRAAPSGARQDLGRTPGGDGY